MKNISILSIIAISTLFVSCASRAELSQYDDDVYGDFAFDVVAGTESSDEYFEEGEYYSETPAVQNNNSNNNK